MLRPPRIEEHIFGERLIPAISGGSAPRNDLLKADSQTIRIALFANTAPIRDHSCK
jgi:hypothetical protein